MIQILQGDCIEKLRTMPDCSVHCCVTSPPYWGLRDYGVAGQIGLEKTPEDYVAKMVAVFREVKRVLRDDGTLWLNLGDSYAAGKCGRDDSGNNGRFGGPRIQPTQRSAPDGLKPKDLCGIPWRVAFALQADGWYLRSEITWCKKSAMPESCTDRPSTATEKIFLFSKSQSYFYDHLAVRSPLSEATLPQIGQDYEGNGRKDYFEAGVQNPSDTKRRIIASLEKNGGANLRNYWLLGPEPFKAAHFATFPTEIPRRAILLGTSARGCCPKCGAPWERVVETTREKDPNRHTGRAAAGCDDRQDGDWPRMLSKTETTGWKPTCKCGDNYMEIGDGDPPVKFGTQPPIPCTVLDPFGGSGTTGEVSLELGRKAILIELNPEYVELIKQRTNVTPGLQLA